MTAALRTNVTYDEYLALERTTDQKHEFLRGDVFAMAGGTLEHAILAANVIAALRGLARTRGCMVATSDAKVHVEATGLSTYPDASVVCGPIERAPVDANAMTNPTVLVEVLSESTEAYDRGSKFAHYRALPSLREFVLVSQQERRVEVFRRRDDNGWEFHDATGSEAVELPSLGGHLTLDDIYQGVLPRPG